MATLQRTTSRSAPNPVPVSMGSVHLRAAEVGPFRINAVRFAPGARLPPHVHERPILAVLLEGSFDDVFRRRTLECMPATVLTEPACEMHANRFGRSGAHVVALELDVASDELRPFARVLDRIDTYRDPALRLLSRRIEAELATPDAVSPLMLTGLAHELIAGGVRRTTKGHESGAPSWLSRVRDLLHDRCTEPVSLTELGAVAGVHPAHLARTFRERYGTAIGSYVRRLRVDRAAERLAATDVSLARLALDLGFSDQSHFTRAFRRYMGTTPHRYRARFRAGADVDSHPPARPPMPFTAER